ncbi:MAG: endonuclease III domain-containing protein [Candidatus Muiribacteriaceae bacterium]
MISNIDRIIRTLQEDTETFTIPSVTSIAGHSTPFRILVSTLLSLRTKDEVTLEVSLKLFRIADTPEKIISLPVDRLEKLIFPTGFYHNKAKTLKHVSSVIKEKYDGKVPHTLEELTSIKGVGRKTANLVLIKAFDRYGICVDTHVHRICNRLGIVHTDNADKTELALRETLPKKYWKIINDLMVKYGQNICRPVNPHCKECRLSDICLYFSQKKSPQ